MVQAQATVKGVIFKKNTSARVSQVLITNSAGTVMMSDELGLFNIKAAIGDTITFSKIGYTPQKQVVNNNSDILIYLQPVVELEGVIIKGQTKQQELAEVMRTYRSKGIYFDGKPPVTAFLPFGGSPITGFYELFGKAPKQARHFKQYIKTENEQSLVSRRYTKELVKRVTLLDDEEVAKFMNNYKPSYEDVVKWTDYDLIAYIKRSLEYYKSNGDKPALQRLYE
jgi:hypothetical protein